MNKPTKLNRTFGGFAWPADNPGFAVLVGEQINEKIIGARHELVRQYHILTEFESHNMEVLIRMASALSTRYKCQGWYGRLHKRAQKPLPSMNYLESWNRDAGRRRVKPFYIYDAPFVEETGYIQYHLNLLKPLLNPDKKMLVLYDSALKGYLLNIPTDVTNAKDLDYPAVAALAYAISALEVWNPEDMMREDYEIERSLKELLEE